MNGNDAMELECNTRQMQPPVVLKRRVLIDQNAIEVNNKEKHGIRVGAVCITTNLGTPSEDEMPSAVMQMTTYFVEPCDKGYKKTEAN